MNRHTGQPLTTDLHFNDSIHCGKERRGEEGEHVKDYDSTVIVFSKQRPLLISFQKVSQVSSVESQNSSLAFFPFEWQKIISRPLALAKT